MTNSTNNRIRKYVAGGILSVAAVFGGALGSAGAAFAAPADGWDPIAPAVDAPAFTPPPGPWIEKRDPIAQAPVPAAPAPVAPAPALRAPAAPAPAAPVAPARKTPAHRAPAADAPGQTGAHSRTGDDHKSGSDRGQSSKGRSH